MKKRMNLRVLSFFLAMITVFISTSFTAISEETTANQPEPVTSSPTSDETTSSGTSEALSWTAEPVYHYAVNEIPDLREENVKHFYMPDGTYKAVVYADSIHRQDATGEWKDIDNSLSLKSVSGTNKYSTSDGRVTFAPVFTHNSNVMTLTENGYTVSMAMTGTLPDHISTQNVPLTMTDAGVNRNERLGWYSIDDAANIDTSSSVKYTNVAEKTDLEYILTGNDIKENIIIKAPQSGYEYTFILTLSGLTAVLENNGSITLSDAETGDAVYFIPAPYMYDAAGNTSHSVSYSLLTIKDEIYALTVTADSEWINAEGRAFPVTVDPTVNSSTACRDTYISSSSPTTNYGTAEYLLLTSEDNIGLIRHVSPGFPEDAIIRKVELNVYYYFPTSTYGEVELWFSPILQSWNPLTITWSSANLSTPLDRFYHVIDLEVSETATCSSPALATFDVTTIYERWLEEESSTYYGIAIEQQFTDKDLRIKSYESAAQYRPYYVYTYTDIIQDGVYSLQNMASMTYTTIGDMSIFEGSSVEQVSLTGNPVNTFNRQGLFKITGIEGTDRFVIRSMINNKHTISMTSDGMVTKEIPAYDSDVALEDTYYIEYGMDGVEFRPAGTPTYALSVDSSTLDISTVPEASIGMGESWVITKYSGSEQTDADYCIDTSHLELGEISILTPYSWSTVPGANMVIANVASQSSEMVDAIWLSDGYLRITPLRYGPVTFSMAVFRNNESRLLKSKTDYILPDEGTYYLQNVGTERYMDVEGPSTSAGANIQQWDFHTGDQEQWILEYVLSAPGYVRFKSKYSGLYLGVNSSNTSQVKQYLTVSDYTLWSVQTTDSGNVKLICKATESSGKALAVPSSTNANGTDLTQVAYTDDTDYRDEWSIKRFLSCVNYYDSTFVNNLTLIQNISTANSFSNFVYSKYFNIVMCMDGSATQYNTVAHDCTTGTNTPCDNTLCGSDCNVLHHKNGLVISNQLYTDSREDNHIYILWTNRDYQTYCNEDSGEHSLVGWIAVVYGKRPVIHFMTIDGNTNVQLACMALNLVHETAHVLGMSDVYDNDGHDIKNETVCVMERFDARNAYAFYQDVLNGVAQPFCDTCNESMKIHTSDIFIRGN